MDNVTHALAGMLLAEIVVQHRERREVLPARWGRWAYAGSAIAHNLPDLDIVYIGITGGKLGYLAHHRGHTHTLAFALALAAALLLVLRLRRSESWTQRDRRWLAALVALGPFLHLLMDWGNNYGVHPFWPLDNRWFYGDAMFIVEPLLWASVAPVLAVAVKSRLAKGLLLSVALAGIALSWLTSYVPPPLAMVVTLWTAAIGLAAWRMSARARSALAVGSALLVYALFVAAGARARRLVSEAAEHDHPAERLVEAALAPLPANPLCWRINSLWLAGEDIVLRRGTVTPLSRADESTLCLERAGTPTAPLTPAGGGSGAGPVRWELEMRYSQRVLRELWSDCHARVYLRWSRLPYWMELEGQTVLGDLRYDSEPSLSWSEIALPEGASCPPFVPAWVPPQWELLAP